jgi:hypothetical protein
LWSFSDSRGHRDRHGGFLVEIVASAGSFKLLDRSDHAIEDDESSSVADAVINDCSTLKKSILRLDNIKYLQLTFSLPSF